MPHAAEALGVALIVFSAALLCGRQESSAPAGTRRAKLDARLARIPLSAYVVGLAVGVALLVVANL